MTTKPLTLCVVTATTDPVRAEGCFKSWRLRSATNVVPIVVQNGGKSQQPYLGTVPAFRRGVDEALANTDAEVIALLHDDLEIQEDSWDQRVLRLFQHYPAVGLAGFGGAIGLGADTLYREPYDPMQLARIGFRSNLIDAETHGIRSLLAERVACLDGFSQIGRRAFWEGRHPSLPAQDERPWTLLERQGFRHHAYDGALGALARRYGWETWYLPVRCRHFGGQTAVGDRGYQAWAETVVAGGDQGFWREAHRLLYDEFRDVLPLRV